MHSIALYDCPVEKRDDTYQQGPGHKVHLNCKINLNIVTPNFEAFAACPS